MVTIALAVLALKLALLFALLWWKQYHKTRRVFFFYARRMLMQQKRALGQRARCIALETWLEKVEREHAERRQLICEAITRRPPRRAWLQIARHVARLGA